MAGEQFKNATLPVKRRFIKDTARRFGLRVTSERGGKHVSGSFHYQGRAIDVAGSAAGMSGFFKAFAPLADELMGVRELFYDPEGAYDDGYRIPPVGGHGRHVHIAFDPPPAR